MTEAQNKSRWLVVCLSLVPVWLVVSAGAAVWWSINKDDKNEEERNQRFAMEMSVERIADDLRKLDEVIGPRNKANPENLKRAAAMIDGILGPSNTGYQTRRIPGPNDVPVIQVTVAGKDGDAAPYWVIASFDTSEEGDLISTQTSSVAALIAVAQAMSRDQPEQDIHFLFYPIGNGSDSGTKALTKNLLAVLTPPKCVFYIGGMDFGSKTGSTLTAISAMQEDSIEVRALQGIGQHHKDGPVSLAVFGIQSTDLPTLYVLSTILPGSELDQSANNIAISAGKLVEWLRRADRLQAAE